MQRIQHDEARALFLAGQGLAERHDRRPTRRALLRAIDDLGYVQVDAIQVVERAHHLILRARFQGYRPRHLTALLERDRSLFEHWTHDAAVIPTRFLPWWDFHFRYWRERHASRFHRQPGGTRGFRRLLREVQARIEAEGPLRASDFEAPPDHQGGSFWAWKPAKIALEVLWRRGDLAIAGRDGFQKRYDLFARVHPDAERPRLTRRAYLDWALPEALARLGTATPAELAGFWGNLPVAEAQGWCRRALRDGRLIEASVAPGAPDEPEHRTLALPDLPSRLARLRAPPPGLRLLCPFDPLIRDRRRARRLFGFDYRFEGFVPAAKRRDGYFVMAVLDGDRLVARFDPRLDRETKCLEVSRLRWEPGQETSMRRRRLHESLGDWAHAMDAESLAVS